MIAFRIAKLHLCYHLFEMNIYIVRHAIAEDQPRSGTGDHLRQLSEEGKKKMKEAADGFARMKLEIDAIFCSPLIRAKQTAEIVAKALKKETEEMVELSPGHSPEDVCRKLRGFKKSESVMLVGHEPNCSDLAAYFLGDIAVEFKKGAICLIESDDLLKHRGTLIWHLSPAVLRLMAG